MNSPHDDILPELTRELTRSWGVPVAQGHDSDWDVVCAALEERIAHLLRHDPRRLTTAMYLLDVSERSFAAAMDQPTTEDRAHTLALTGMERETQKIRTRLKYGKQG